MNRYFIKVLARACSEGMLATINQKNELKGTTSRRDMAAPLYKPFNMHKWKPNKTKRKIVAAPARLTTLLEVLRLLN